MDAAERRFAGSVPQLYERHLATAMFAPYAEHVADVVAAGRPGAVLEVAAGTGLVTRRLAAALPGSRIVATDLNRPMLDEAARLLTWPGVEWREADAADLPFDDGAFDAVVCQFGAMFFPDRPAAYREARRVLTPDGRLVLAVWDRVEANEFAAVVADVIREVLPDDPPDFVTRVPHGYADPEVIEDDLVAAGFGGVTVEHVRLTGTSPSARELAVGFVQGTPTGGVVAARDPDGVARTVDRLTAAFAERFGATDLRGRLAAYVATATAGAGSRDAARR